MYETAVPRGEWLDFAPNEDNEVPSDDEKEDGRSIKSFVVKCPFNCL